MMDKNIRFTPKGDIEGAFRRQVRDILDVDIFTRDETILDELRRLKDIDKTLRVVSTIRFVRQS